MMITLHIYVMNPRILFIMSLLLLHLLDTTIATSLVHQLGGNGGINKCIHKERHALLHFKARLQDPQGQLLTWRPEDHDCCKWSGVTCNNQTGHVTKLHLSFQLSNLTLSYQIPNLTLFYYYRVTQSGPIKRLEGEISTSLLSLSYLNHLDLSYNSFHGTIPGFFGSMTRLRYLNLRLNSFSGTIPRSIIGSLTELRFLDLSVNSLHGTIPNSIGSLTKLRFLDLSVNSLDGTIPNSIGSLTKLRFLDLSDNSLHGSIPPEFGNLTNLRNLSLGCSASTCKIENLDWLSHLSHLQSLQMQGISLAKANLWVNVILSLQNLSDLSLRNCNLSEVMHPYSSFVNSSSSIASLTLADNNLNSSMYRWLFPLTSNRLLELDLSHNKLDWISKYLGNLCGLTSLYLHDNLVAVKFPDFLNNLSGCTSDTLNELYAPDNQLTGSLSDEIQKFSHLETLFLSYNHLNGTISNKVWELPTLKTLDVSSNSLRGGISKHFLESNLRMIDISNNILQVIPSKAHMSNLSYVEYIDLSANKLGPLFPKWIQKHKNLTHLSMANTRISDTIPVEFWNVWPSRLIYLDLSSNNISGEVPNLLSNFDRYASIDLSSNNLLGPIRNVPSSLVSLNLSRNKFCGGISFVCQIVDGFLEFLDLSHNSLTGQLPDCLWHFNELKVLNLGHNHLSGRLPASIGYLVQLEVLQLYNNFFLGELPLALKKCTKLTFLDLGANKFFGNVPVWIGENLTWLYALSLRSNNFFGPIPLQLCRLMDLQILDLSRNNLNGTIPSCVNNLNAMVQGDFSWGNSIHRLPTYYYVTSYVDTAMMKWQGNEREVTSNLGLLSIIDLSSNNLTGQIPNELTDLRRLLVLDLSKNALFREIPQKIGEMTELLTLDLSRNNFSGRIPSSLSQIAMLNDLDVSYNNLSGRIPSGTQLQSFEPSRYTGNAGLCGPPITKYCPGDEELEAPPLGESVGGGEGMDELQRWFYIGGGTGFVTGFWIACGALLLNHRGRHAFFYFLDSLKDWVYVKVMVCIRKLQRVAHST